jgi:hypothetical protein
MTKIYDHTETKKYDVEWLYNGGTYKEWRKVALYICRVQMDDVWYGTSYVSQKQAEEYVEELKKHYPTVIYRVVEITSKAV